MCIWNIMDLNFMTLKTIQTLDFKQKNLEWLFLTPVIICCFLFSVLSWYYQNLVYSFSFKVARFQVVIASREIETI